ncbi:MAG: hypothetical protein WDM90_06480 [Ferruginibacter sp.]
MKEQKNIETLNNSPHPERRRRAADGGIIIIADDFTGAAELAGISLRYSLTLPIFLWVIETVERLNNLPFRGRGHYLHRQPFFEY